MAKSVNTEAYLARVQHTQKRRLTWWREARFGMFVHYGLYSQLARGEWVMNIERIPAEEYELLANTWHPKPGCAREWAALAKAAGMRYIVLTTKHHEGYCLWDTAQTDFNAVRRGPGRDLVREYIDAAREAGLRVGLYYSLMDWHHPDGIRCAHDEASRKRFVAFTQGCVRELLSNYGKIDILWYDVSWPLKTPENWDSYRLNALARKLQPEILINDRAQLPEDFGTPEEHITPTTGGRAWEACMTFNGVWGWVPTPPEDWHPVRKVIDMLRICTAGGGNLLLNIGPLPDGTVPTEAVNRLETVGKWLDRYGEAAYGRVDPINGIIASTGSWTRKGNRVYLWCSRWPGSELALGAIYGKLVSARLYPEGIPLRFSQQDDRLVIKGLPAECPDPIAGVGMLELTFRTPPVQHFNAAPVPPEVLPADLTGKWVSPPWTEWRLSPLYPKTDSINEVACVSGVGSAEWQLVRASTNHFVNLHDVFGERDGFAYLSSTLTVSQDGEWIFHLGHDGGVRIFLDGEALFVETKCVNPAVPGRSSILLSLTEGSHELVVAFDTCAGRGWGIYACCEVHAGHRGKMKRPQFPLVTS